MSSNTLSAEIPGDARSRFTRKARWLSAGFASDQRGSRALELNRKRRKRWRSRLAASAGGGHTPKTRGPRCAGRHHSLAARECALCPSLAHGVPRAALMDGSRAGPAPAACGFPPPRATGAPQLGRAVEQTKRGKWHAWAIPLESERAPETRGGGNLKE